MLISSVWGMTVSLNRLLVVGKVYQIGLSSPADEAINYGLLIGMAAFTRYDSSVLHRRTLEARPH